MPADRHPVDTTDPQAAARLLRDLCGNFPTGVTVVTSLDGEAPRGVTVNSFTSVSLTPPLVLVCIDHRSSSARSIAQSGAFCVHFLTGEQWEWALGFARPGDDKFDGIDWERGRVVREHRDVEVAALECRLVSHHDGGDHAIFVGQVEASHAEAVADGVLGFFRGRLVRIDGQVGLFPEVLDLPAESLIGSLW